MIKIKQQNILLILTLKKVQIIETNNTKDPDPSLELDPDPHSPNLVDPNLDDPNLH